MVTRLNWICAARTERNARSTHCTVSLGQVGSAFVPLLAVIDWLSFFSLLGFLWIAMEIGQRESMPRDLPGADALRYHRAGLVAVCSVVLVLHAVNFLAVPLRVTKDGPSYVQGLCTGHRVAISMVPHPIADREPPCCWAGNDDLWTESMGCEVCAACPGVPLRAAGIPYWLAATATALGAIAAGMAAGLSPDLYAYSNFVCLRFRISSRCSFFAPR